MVKGRGNKTHLDQENRVFSKNASDALGAYSIRERYILFHVGDLLRLCVRCITIGSLLPLPSSFARGVAVIIAVDTVPVAITAEVIAIVAVVFSAAFIAFAAFARSLAGDTLLVVVRDTQDTAVADDVRLAERVHAVYIGQAGAALRYMRHHCQHRISGAPGVPGHHGDLGRSRVIGVDGRHTGAQIRARALAVRGDVG
jgi:hypothetical protein